MSSLNDFEYFTLSPKEEAGTDFVTMLGEELQRAFLKRKAEAKLTYQQIADLLEINRGRVHRCFSGHTNLTAETIGELGWALGGKAKVVIVFDEDDKTPSQKKNYHDGGRYEPAIAPRETANSAVTVTSWVAKRPQTVGVGNG